VNVFPDRSWSSEASLVITGFAILVFLGLWFGTMVLTLLAGATLYLFWHLVNLYRLSHWLKEGTNTPPPEVWGVWDGIFHDIYRRGRGYRKRKRKLNRALRRFIESTAALPDGIVVLGRNDEIEWWNAAAERLLGLRRPDDRGQQIGNLLRHPAFVQHLAEEVTWHQPLLIPAPVDEAILLHTTVLPTGRKKRLLIAQDATRLHRLEQMRRDFVANVSHELRTPLTVVSGYVESLLGHEDAHKVPWKRALPHIYQQTRRMQRIVDDLLLLSKLELNAEQQNQDLVHIAPILTAIREEAVELSGEEKHRIELQMDTHLGIIGNATELHSAFSNLVSNAVRYTPRGGHIRICWYANAKGAFLSVADTGVGIEARHIPRLTERFYRVDVGRSRKSGGTGLGLAIVKHVLSRHQGELSITSEVGKGSTFTCHFPCHYFYWLNSDVSFSEIAGPVDTLALEG
jgi:two-component system phosphate regulon sensor histidine kinase PhoR